VTTTDAAAARRQHRLVALALVFGLAGFGLAGCGSSIFDSAGTPSSEVAPPKAVAEQAPVSRVVVNPVVGPPDDLGKQLRQEMVSALNVQRVAVADQGAGADYHLRPYIVAAKEMSGTKLSYVMDVTDPAGSRVNRFTGEEIVPAGGGKDTWAAVTPAVMQSIAGKATGAFVSWLPNARPAVAASPPPSGVGGEKVETASVPPAAKAARPGTRVASAPPAQTGSITKDGNVMALVPPVTGAPGDGTTSLTAAIQRELKSKGVALADRSGGAAYRVEGAVTVGQARDGKQPIQIEWIVKDPQGKRLGTVSQKNDIPEGSLDGPWGRTAEQAAGAAAQGIVKLLPGATAVN
jgi:uncharacterized lipoprotein YmbA